LVLRNEYVSFTKYSGEKHTEYSFLNAAGEGEREREKREIEK